MTNTITGKLTSKNYDWWIELEGGKQLRVYHMKVYNSSDLFVRLKGKKYGVTIDTDNMSAEIELWREV